MTVVLVVTTQIFLSDLVLLLHLLPLGALLTPQGPSTRKVVVSGISLS